MNQAQAKMVFDADRLAALERRVEALERRCVLPADTMLTSAQLVPLLPFGIRTLWRMIAAGRFPPPVRYTRQLVRWRKSEVMAWLAGNGTPAG